MIVVRGSSANTQLIANHCKTSIEARVFTPQKGKIVDAITESHVYKIQLTEAYVLTINFQTGHDSEVARIDGQIAICISNLMKKRMSWNVDP